MPRAFMMISMPPVHLTEHLIATRVVRVVAAGIANQLDGLNVNDDIVPAATEPLKDLHARLQRGESFVSLPEEPLILLLACVVSILELAGHVLDEREETRLMRAIRNICELELARRDVTHGPTLLPRADLLLGVTKIIQS